LGEFWLGLYRVLILNNGFLKFLFFKVGLSPLHVLRSFLSRVAAAGEERKHQEHGKKALAKTAAEKPHLNLHSKNVVNPLPKKRTLR
jgi:hypothetical protein